MRTRKILLAELDMRLEEICEDIEQNGSVWDIVTSDSHSFVLVQPAIGERVLGLYDVEYGWPEMVDIHLARLPGDIVPKYRCHPFLMREGRCVAVAMSLKEYEDILKMLADER